jgi:plasmid stabilization system protein ParE
MGFRVELTAKAESDIDSALDSLTRHSHQAAVRWFAALLAKVATLEVQPERWR